MGSSYSECDYAPIDLSKSQLAACQVSDTSSLRRYLDTHHERHEAKWLYGGYMEKRSLYQSDLFLGEPSAVRDIHLGVDIWGPVDSPIYAPLAGKIHSFAFNDLPLDYGYTVILKHDVEGLVFYTLYGHLSSSFHDRWKIGQAIASGEEIGALGAVEENGGWLPHVHFQLMTDMQGRKGDFPGVCSESDREKYAALCPDPMDLIVF